MTNPEVSIIIPVYNAEPYLKECMDSVLGQTIRDTEIICINDGSTDGSRDVLSMYAASDERIVLVDQENQGAGRSRNRGLKLARGKYVGFMDPDDLYPDARVLEDLLRKMKEYGVRACGGCMVQFFADGRRLEHYSGDNFGYEFTEEAVIDYRDYQFEYGYTRFLYERTLLEGLEFPAYLRFQDPPFFVRALSAAGKFCALPRVTYLYRNTPKEIDWKGAGYQRLKDYLRGMTNVAVFAKENGFEQLLERLVNRLVVGGGRFLWSGAYIHAIRQELSDLFHALGPDLTTLLITKRTYYTEKTAAHIIGTTISSHTPGFKEIKDVIQWDEGGAHWLSFEYTRRDGK